MSIFDRATKEILDDEKHEVFKLYIAKASEFFGVTSTREIYERAIEVCCRRRTGLMCLVMAPDGVDVPSYGAGRG